jgi:hypothetical protein
MAIPKLKLVTTSPAATSHQPLSMAVCIPDQKHIPAGAIITSQSDLESLPSVTRNNCYQVNCHQTGKHRPVLALIA